MAHPAFGALSSYSVEARSNFLDLQWVEWTARLSERLRVRRMVSKWLLKAAFGELLPPATYAHGKQVFGVPVAHCSKTNSALQTREYPPILRMVLPNRGRAFA